jgi:FkbM family methyltransferase
MNYPEWVPQNARLFLRSLRRRWTRLSSTRLVCLHDLYLYWEQLHLRTLLRHLDVDCVFDVGANHGQYAEMLRRAAGYKGLIVSFEPIPEAASIVRAKAARDDAWIVEEMALGTSNGTTSFQVMQDSQYSSLSTPRHDEVSSLSHANEVSRVIAVKTETLESAYERLVDRYQFCRPFLKLDTQGFDVNVIQSGERVIGRFVGLQSELAICKLYASSTDYREALSYYQSLGFSLSAFVPNNAGHFPLMVETDCIMIRELGPDPDGVTHPSAH